MAPRLVLLCNLELPEKDDGKLPPSFFSSPVGLYRDNYTAKKGDFALFPNFIGSFESNSPKRPFSGVIWAGNEKRCRNDKGAILYIPAANWQAYGESIKSRFLPEQALANIRIV